MLPICLHLLQVQSFRPYLFDCKLSFFQLFDTLVNLRSTGCTAARKSPLSHRSQTDLRVMSGCHVSDCYEGVRTRESFLHRRVHTDARHNVVSRSRSFLFPVYLPNTWCSRILASRMETFEEGHRTSKVSQIDTMETWLIPFTPIRGNDDLEFSINPVSPLLSLTLIAYTSQLVCSSCRTWKYRLPGLGYRHATQHVVRYRHEPVINIFRPGPTPAQSVVMRAAS
jgi:hypothetical protein